MFTFLATPPLLVLMFPHFQLLPFIITPLQKSLLISKVPNTLFFNPHPPTISLLVHVLS